MSRFVQGADRRRQTLLPECLDDYVAGDNPVRVVDVFIDELDLRGLGFEGMTPVTWRALRRARRSRGTRGHRGVPHVRRRVAQPIIRPCC
jgi:hypothetical protein